MGETPNTTAVDKNFTSQAWQAAQITGDILLIIVRFFYYILEAIYRLFVPLPIKSVKGEIVLITGAGHGIGKELALKYASEGATVVAWDINGDTCRETVKEIAKLGYTKAYAYVCDVSSNENVQEVAKKVEKEVGDISIIINNAGIMPTRVTEDYSVEEIERIFKINVFAHFWIIRAFLPKMKQNNHGHIVALSSCAGIIGFRNLVPYCASKYAVHGLMEALFEEVRFNPNSRIKFTTIFPYMVDTGLCKKPRIRFERFMPLLTPKYVAEFIMNAQRRNVLETTIPPYIYSLAVLGRMLPIKGAMALLDFFNTGVDPE